VIICQNLNCGFSGKYKLKREYMKSELKDNIEPTKKIMLIINNCFTIGDTLYII
tara:strand:- start:2241 stop:2402 length:162 start_codon:yes stop_codon:yes gene_type:complete